MGESPIDRQLLAILYGDLVGYTRLMRADEEATLIELRSHFDEVIRPAITRHRGHLVKTTGDGFIASFISPVEAARCAVEIQRDLEHRTAAQRKEQRQLFRLGLHLGDVIVTADDVFGDAVNVAARLQALAQPGEIYLSAAAYEQVRNHLDSQFRDLGEFAVKNLDRPIRVFAMGQVLRAGRRSWLVTAAVAGLAAATIAIGSVIWLTRPPTPQPLALRSDRPTVAVLPFVNQSGDAAQDFFSDGITEDVIAALGRFQGLTVMARNAVFPYKGKVMKPAEIGRELNARYLVEGSVRRSGERVRLAAQLTEARTGKLLWSERYDDELKDVFAVQQTLANKVAGTLAVSLDRVEQQRVVAKPTPNIDAYELVLRARAHLVQLTRADNRAARQLLERVIDLDPRYADAYALLGTALLAQADYGWTEFVDEANQRAEALGRQALALDADNAVALRLLTSVYTQQLQYDRAMPIADRALAINPNDASIMLARGHALLWLGQVEKSIVALEIALALDPNLPASAAMNLGIAYYQMRRNAEAVQVLERGIARYPDEVFLHVVLAATYAQIGRLPEATRERDIVGRLNPFFDPAQFGSRARDPAHHAYLVEGMLKAGLR